MTLYPETHWAFEDPDAAARRDADEPTSVVPTSEAYATRVDESGAHATRVDVPAPQPTATYPPARPLLVTPAIPPVSARPADPRPAVVPVGGPPSPLVQPVPPMMTTPPAPLSGQPVSPARPGGVPGAASELVNARYGDVWALQLARMNNRATTDIGLLVLRLAFLPLVLHGVHAYLSYDNVLDAVGSGLPVPAAVLAVGLLTVWFLAPITIATGFGTRIAGALIAAAAGLWYLTVVSDLGSWFEPATGTLAGEIWLAHGVGGAVLFLTGAGRFSLDHVLTSARRDRIADKRVNRHLGA